MNDSRTGIAVCQLSAHVFGVFAIGCLAIIAAFGPVCGLYERGSVDLYRIQAFYSPILTAARAVPGGRALLKAYARACGLGPAGVSLLFGDVQFHRGPAEPSLPRKSSRRR